MDGKTGKNNDGKGSIVRETRVRHDHQHPDLFRNDIINIF